MIDGLLALATIMGVYVLIEVVAARARGAWRIAEREAAAREARQRRRWHKWD